jgi:hypothetical protein
MSNLFFSKLFLSSLLLFLMACDTTNKKERPYTGFTVDPNSSVHRFAVAELQKFPQWATNSVLRERADTQYRKDLAGFLSQPQSLQDVCFRCAHVSEYQPGKYVVQLVNDEQEVNTVRLDIEVAGLIPDSFVTRLREGAYYKFTGHYQQLVGEDAYNYIKNSFNDKTTLDVYNTDSVLYFGLALYHISSIDSCTRKGPMD